MGTFLNDGVSCNFRMISPPRTHKLLACLRSVLPRELALHQMIQERPEAPDDLLAGRHVFRASHPSSGPLVEVCAEGRRSSATAACGPGAACDTVRRFVFALGRPWT